MKGHLSHAISFSLVTLIGACSSIAPVETTAVDAEAFMNPEERSTQWTGASVSELLAAMGTPSETLNAMPEHGLAPSVSWYSSSEDYAALELLEIESSRGGAQQQNSDRHLVDGSDSHECQIHARLSADGLRVERLTRQSIGDCERWLPMPDRPSFSSLTAAIDD